MFSITFTVTKQQWIANPRLRWKAGLEGAGIQFRQHLQRSYYPPPPPMTSYVRTGLTADKAGFQIEDNPDSLAMAFGSTFYLPYLLYGTQYWVGWTPWDKKGELLRYMIEGFKQGVKNYTE